MDRIIEEYINIEFIQKQILFGRKNLEWLLKDNWKQQLCQQNACPTNN